MSTSLISPRKLLLIALAASTVCLTVPPPATAVAPMNGTGFGLADNVRGRTAAGAPLDAQYDTLIFRMQPKVYRVQIPYDIAIYNSDAARARMNELKHAIQLARANGVTSVLATFAMGWNDYNAVPIKKWKSDATIDQYPGVPTADMYRYSIRAAIAQFDSLVDVWSPANEPNAGWRWFRDVHDTEFGPKRLAEYFRVLEQEKPPNDMIISPEFHDNVQMPAGTPHYVKTSGLTAHEQAHNPEWANWTTTRHFIYHYLHHGGGWGSAAAFHPYGSVRSGNYAAFNDFKSLVPAGLPIWLTEIGGTRRPDTMPPNQNYDAPISQDDQVMRLVNLIKSDDKIERAYYYMPVQDGSETWDSALLNTNGSPRSVWTRWCTEARGGNAALCDPATPPVVTITSPTQNAVLNKNSVRATFQANEPATFRCSWDNGAASDCGSPAGHIDLADGAHSLTVTATDLAGNAASTHVAFTVNNASAPPEAKIMLVRNHAASWNVMHGGEVIPLAGGSWSQTCGNGYAAAGDLLDANGFRLCVRSDMAERRFFLGNVVSDAGNYYHVKQGQVESFGGAGWSYCPAGSQLVGQEVHSNGFWLCMAAANDPDPEARTMTVRNNVPYSYASYHGVNYYTGGGAWGQECKDGSEPYGQVFSENGFSLCVRSDLTDRNFYVGNVVNDTGGYYKLFQETVTYLGAATWGYCPAGASMVGQTFHSNGFLICMDDEPLPPDTTPPAIQILTPASGATLTTSTIESTFTADEPADFRCKLDNGSFATCQSPWSPTNVANGAHVLSVEATDPAGNVSVSSVSFNVNVPNGPQAKLAIIRSDAAYYYALEGGLTTYLGGWGWGVPCGSGMQHYGQIFSSNGFSLCVRSDLAGRNFYVGNVVNNAGYLYSVNQGAITYLGGASWGYCPPGSSNIGQSFHSNGFLVCMDNTA